MADMTVVVLDSGVVEVYCRGRRRGRDVKRDKWLVTPRPDNFLSWHEAARAPTFRLPRGELRMSTSRLATDNT